MIDAQWAALSKVAYEQIVSDFLVNAAFETERMDEANRKHKAWLAEQSLPYRLRYKARLWRGRAQSRWDDFRRWLSNKIYAHPDDW